MNNTKKKKALRKQRRFKVENGAFAAVRNKANLLGQIKDISFGGLAFKYLAGEGVPDGARTLDIFITRHRFHIKDIPVQFVHNTKVAKEDPFSTVTIRQQGVQFGDLSDEHRAQLKQLIHYHTVGES